MCDTADRLEKVVNDAAPVQLRLSEEGAERRPGPGKWSPKEIIGHLIDSTSNNHRRFVEAQFGEELVFPGYDADRWVDVQNYNERPWAPLVELWHRKNLHMAHVIRSVPGEVRNLPRVKHNLHLVAFRKASEAEPVTLEYFMKDYVDHLVHHLAAIPEE